LITTGEINMKIQLVQTKLGQNRMKNGRDMMVFPLGLLATATYVNLHSPSADIEVVDGDFEPDLESKLDGDVIGVQPNILNVDSDLLTKLHDRGQKIVVGGVHATQTGQELAQQPFIDYVCNGDGEIVMLEASKGVDLDKITGLSSATKVGTFQKLPVSELPIVDRGLYDQERYMANSTKFFDAYMPSRPFRRMTNMYSNKGCVWRADTGGCYFCGRFYGGLDLRPADSVWQEVKELKETYDADFIWDVSDSFASSKEWLQDMIDQKPAGDMPHWYVYARVSELKDEERLKMLADIGVYQVLIGVETGCDKIAEDITKGNTNSDTFGLAVKAKEYGIKLLPSFVVGLPGETEESLEMTYQVAQRTVELNGCEELSVSMLIPLPGSKAFKVLRDAYRFDTGNDLPLLTDGEQYQRHWFDYKCKTDFDTAVGYMYKMMALTPLKSTFGLPHLKIDPRMPGWNQLNAEHRHELFNGDKSES
jgi:radical SAM superfamily enzyme YgiQ (UPF0313 family)